MTNKTYTKLSLIGALGVMSLGGWLLHSRIHPPSRDLANLIPAITTLAGLLAIPVLLWFRKTFHLGYILNGMSVLIGAITMAHFSAAHLPQPLTAWSLMFRTTFPDIMILGGKLGIGLALMRIEFFPLNNPVKGQWWRYPFFGWWIIHLAAMAIVYSLGAILWP